MRAPGSAAGISAVRGRPAGGVLATVRRSGWLRSPAVVRGGDMAVAIAFCKKRPLGRHRFSMLNLLRLGLVEIGAQKGPGDVLSLVAVALAAAPLRVLAVSLGTAAARMPTWGGAWVGDPLLRATPIEKAIRWPPSR